MSRQYTVPGTMKSSSKGEMGLDAQATGKYDEWAGADQLQEVYEHVLNDRRPEAVGAIEKLAKHMDIKIERPDQFRKQTRR